MRKEIINILCIALIVAILMLSVSACAFIGNNSTSKSESKPSQSTENSNPLPSMLKDRKFELTFYDDFDGNKLNKSNWKYCPEEKRQDYGGKWQDELIELDGQGNLLVKFDVDKNGTPVSGAIRTKGKFEQAKGYFEIRCKLQQATGCWGAFWLMAGNVSKVGNGAVDGVEIDIFESFNPGESTIGQAMHYDGYRKHHQYVDRWFSHSLLYNDDFHTFSLLWDDTGYYYFVDGVKVNSVTAEDEDFPGVCDKKGYLKVTGEFGTWAGEIDLQKLPDAMTVDYVKVYKEVK